MPIVTIPAPIRAQIERREQQEIPTPPSMHSPLCACEMCMVELFCGQYGLDSEA